MSIINHDWTERSAVSPCFCGVCELHISLSIAIPKVQLRLGASWWPSQTELHISPTNIVQHRLTAFLHIPSTFSPRIYGRNCTLFPKECCAHLRTLFQSNDTLSERNIALSVGESCKGMPHCLKLMADENNAIAFNNWVDVMFKQNSLLILAKQYISLDDAGVSVRKMQRFLGTKWTCSRFL